MAPKSVHVSSASPESSPPHPVTPAQRRWLWAIVGVILLAVVIRGVMTGYGLPLLLHEDEPVYLRRALLMGFGDFDPHYFKKPTFFLYLYGALYGVIFGVQWLMGQVGTWAEFVQHTWENPTSVILAGRWLTVAFASASVWWMYCIGRDAAHRWVGLVSALLLTLFVTHLRYSPIVISDIPTLFGVLVTAWFAMAIARRGWRRDYVAAAIALGLTMSFKYNVFTALFILAAHLWYHRHSPWWGLLKRELWLCLAGASALFVVLNPYVLLNMGTFLEDINHERKHMLYRDEMNASARSIEWFGALPKMLFKWMPRQLGWPLYIAGWVGIAGILGAYKRVGITLFSAAHRWVLLSFPMGFLLVVSQFQTVNAKYLMPVMVFWILFAVAMVWTLVQRVIPISGGHYARSVVTFFVVVFLLAQPMVTKSLEQVQLMRRPDTRQQVYTALMERINPGDCVYAEPETLPLDLQAFSTDGPSRPQLACWKPDHDPVTPPISGFLRVAKPMPNTMANILSNPLDLTAPPKSTPPGTPKDPSSVPDTLSTPQWLIINPRPPRNSEGGRDMPYAAAYYESIYTHYQWVGYATPQQGWHIPSPTPKTLVPQSEPPASPSSPSAASQSSPVQSSGNDTPDTTPNPPRSSSPTEPQRPFPPLPKTPKQWVWMYEDDLVEEGEPAYLGPVLLLLQRKAGEPTPAGDLK